MKCSKCGVSAEHPCIAGRPYPNVTPLVVSGFLGAWIWQSSKARLFRCASCGEAFRARTASARFAFAVVFVFFALYAAGLLLLILGVMMQSE